MTFPTIALHRATCPCRSVLAVWLGTGVITSIYSFGFAEALEVMGTAALVMTLVGLTFGISLVAYSRAMTQRGILT